MIEEKPISDALLYDRYDDQAQRMLATVIPVFQTTTPPVMVSLRHSFESQASEEFWKAAHTLHGTAGALCASKLTRLASLLQTLGRVGDWEQIGLLLPALEHEYQRVCDYVVGLVPETA